MVTRRSNIVIFYLLIGVSIIGLVISLWLSFSHNMKYIGPVPTVVLYIVPLFIGIWINFWPDRKHNRRRFLFLIVGTIIVAIGLFLMVDWSWSGG